MTPPDDDWSSAFDLILSQQASRKEANPNLQEISEVEQYMVEPIIQKKEDPLLYWQMKKEKFPSLSKLARKHLSTPASSVYSERLFSEYGNIYDKNRSRILPTTGEKLLFLRQNLKKCEE